MEKDLQKVKLAAEKLKQNIELVIKGKSEVIDSVVTAFFSGGHILLEDVPGSGKTSLAKTLAASIDGEFRRVQMTPDLLPADLTGINILNGKTSEFQFVKGPVFANILIADEINRATPKTQSGLLEAMEEGQVSVDGVTYPLEQPFMVIATENPVDTQGVFPLPEAQIDRFLMKLSMDYPKHEDMVEVFRTHLNREVIKQVKPVLTLQEVLEIEAIIEQVSVSDVVIDYVVSLVEATRNHDSVILGVSQRGGIALLRAAKTVAAMKERAYVLPDDIKQIVVDVFAHRLMLKNSERLRKHRAKEIIAELLDTVEVPTEDIV